MPSRTLVQDLVRDMRGVADAVVSATLDADLLLVPAPVSLFGFHIAEGVGIPAIGVFLQPLAPTGDFPPAMAGTRSFGREANRAMGKLLAIGEQPYLQSINDVRASLGLSPETLRGQMRRRLDEWQVLHGFSPTVVARPSDWRAGLDVTGYWWPPRNPDWEPPVGLADFLAAGPPPVFVGLGSTATNDGERLSRIVGSALRKAGVRGVIQSGWARLRGVGPDAITSVRYRTPGCSPTPVSLCTMGVPVRRRRGFARAVRRCRCPAWVISRSGPNDYTCSA